MGRIWIRWVCAFALVAASCGATSLVGMTAAGASGSAALTVKDFTFSPATLTVPVGTTVTVTNGGATTHTWTSDSGSAQVWNSGDINPGASFSVTFNTPGTFGYHCNIHPFMTGRIVVTGTPATTAPPTTTAATTTPATAPAGANPAGPPTSGAAAAAAPVAVQPTVLPHTGAACTLFGTMLLFGASTVHRRRRRFGR
jgi:plastocyanin